MFVLGDPGFHSPFFKTLGKCLIVETGSLLMNKSTHPDARALIVNVVSMGNLSEDALPRCYFRKWWHPLLIAALELAFFTS